MYAVNLLIQTLVLVLTCTTCCLLFLPGINAFIPKFMNGRPRGGMVGFPHISNQTQLWKSASQTKYFVQPLNHFDHSNPKIWKQRYFTRDTFYTDGGPIFVFIGGEAKASPVWLGYGAWIDYAKTYNAYLIVVEHRYYGDSRPTSDMSTENLKYLSSQQALADLSLLIAHFKQKMPKAKVVVFGGSYAGSLAAWFRMKYPHLADGAVASSAPVLAKFDFKEYMEEVGKTLDLFANINCAGNVRIATAMITKALKSQQGRDLLKKEFKLCYDIDPTNKKDVSTLYSNLAGNFLEVIQYNKVNTGFARAKNTDITVSTLCNMMTDTELGNQLHRYAAINSMIMGGSGQKCLEFKYADMIKDLQKVVWNSSAGVGMRQWIYQTCTEFAYFQASESSAQPFGNFFPLDYFLEQCSDIYGTGFSRFEINNGVRKTNIYYGGLNLKITKALFPNGSVDPWHALGILKDLNPEARAIFINGTAHCADMSPPSVNDIPALRKARVEISSAIGQWIK